MYVKDENSFSTCSKTKSVLWPRTVSKVCGVRNKEALEAVTFAGAQ